MQKRSWEWGAKESRHGIPRVSMHRLHVKRIRCIAHRSETIPTESRIFLFLFAVESIEEIPGLSIAIMKIRKTGSLQWNSIRWTSVILASPWSLKEDWKVVRWKDWSDTWRICYGRFLCCNLPLTYYNSSKEAKSVIFIHVDFYSDECYWMFTRFDKFNIDS